MHPEKDYNSNKWKPFNGFSPLITAFRSYHDLTPEIEFIINQHTFPVTFKKNKFISWPLQHSQYLYLIVNGIARGYMKDEQREITTWIAKEDELIGNIYGADDRHSEEYIQALEDMVAVAVPHDLYRRLYLNDHIANYIGRKIAQLHYLQACDRALISRLQTAEKKYIRFMGAYPDLVNRISLKYIASFLCMRMETLSRIRSRLGVST